MSSYDKLSYGSKIKETAVSQHDPATYWLTQIICENAQRLNALPAVIADQHFSHVTFYSVPKEYGRPEKKLRKRGMIERQLVEMSD